MKFNKNLLFGLFLISTLLVFSVAFSIDNGITGNVVDSFEKLSFSGGFSLTGMVVNNLAEEEVVEESFEEEGIILEIKEPQKLGDSIVSDNKNERMDFSYGSSNIRLYFELLDYDQFVEEIVDIVVEEDVLPGIDNDIESGYGVEEEILQESIVSDEIDIQEDSSIEEVSEEEVNDGFGSIGITTGVSEAEGSDEEIDSDVDENQEDLDEVVEEDNNVGEDLGEGTEDAENEFQEEENFVEENDLLEENTGITGNMVRLFGLVGRVVGVDSEVSVSDLEAEDLEGVNLADIQDKAEEIEDSEIDKIEDLSVLEIGDEDFEIEVYEELAEEANVDYKWAYSVELQDYKLLAKIDITSDNSLEIYDSSSLLIDDSLMSFQDLIDSGYSIRFEKPLLELEADVEIGSLELFLEESENLEEVKDEVGDVEILDEEIVEENEEIVVVEEVDELVVDGNEESGSETEPVDSIQVPEEEGSELEDNVEDDFVVDEESSGSVSSVVENLEEGVGSEIETGSEEETSEQIENSELAQENGESDDSSDSNSEISDDSEGVLTNVTGLGSDKIHWLNISVNDTLGNRRDAEISVKVDVAILESITGLGSKGVWKKGESIKETISESFFNLGIKISEESKTVYPGEEVELSILLDVLADSKEGQVKTIYQIYDSNGKLVSTEEGEFLVSNREEYSKSFDIPFTSEQGTCKLFMIAEYDGGVQMASEEFEVVLPDGLSSVGAKSVIEFFKSVNLKKFGNYIKNFFR